MNIVGLDFGTTNSILSFYNDKTKSIESWKMGGVDGISYIPSFLSIEDGDIDIGNTAKENVLYGEDVESYSKFKILLAQTDKSKLSENGFKSKSPKDISALYIKKLLDTYKEEQNIKQIDKIVVSIPEIWLKDNIEARSELESILKDLKLPNFKLESEPISAGAYFLYKYKENHNKDFNGHFIIFDFGGGTLDITLLESSDKKIKTLERTGKGTSERFTGKAGVAFDQLVLKKVIKEQYDIELKEEDKLFQSLMIEFENKKIANSERIEKSINRFIDTKLDKTIFKFERKNYELEIKPSLLIKCFDELFKDDIKKSLIEIKNKFDFYKIDDKDDEKFKIVLVGGFSSFYLSQKAVMDFFGTKTLSDKRFEQAFNTEDLALSISKGATLVANEIVTVEQTYPMSIGIELRHMGGEKFDILILKKGASVKVNVVEYLPHKVTTGKPTFFFDDGSKNGRLKLNHDIEKLYPNINKKDNIWTLGFSIDENSFYYLHIKDKFDNENKIEFSHLVNKFSETIYVDIPKENITRVEKQKVNKDELDEQIKNLKNDIIEARKNTEKSKYYISHFGTEIEPTLKELFERLYKKFNLKFYKKNKLDKMITDLKESKKLTQSQITELYSAKNYKNHKISHRDNMGKNMSKTELNYTFIKMESICSTIELIKEEYGI